MDQAEIGICSECANYDGAKCSKGYKIHELGHVISCKDHKKRPKH